MLADFPKDPHADNQLRVDLDRIKRECPRFLEYLRSSVEQTTQAVEASDGTYHWKETGAMCAMRAILGVILDPPASGGDAAATNPQGMAG